MENTFTYRFVQPEELPRIIEIFNIVSDMSIDGMSGTRTRARIQALVKNNAVKHAGCFDADNKLICSVSAYFPKNKTYWYATNYVSKTSNISLGNGTESTEHLSKCLKCVAQFAEQHEIYMFYSARPARHTFIGMKKGKIHFSRYHRLHDAYYPTGTVITTAMHSFYGPITEDDIIITLNVLKEEFRQEILTQQHPSYSELIKKYMS